MKWAEVIIARSACNSAKIIDTILQDLMTDMSKHAGHEAIRIFRREKPDTDICIVLFHRGKKTKTGGSSLGLHLAAALTEVGLVRHTIWSEIER